MIKKYRKKPVIIEALQWTGKNLSEIDNFIGKVVDNKGTTLVIHHQKKTWKHLFVTAYFKEFKSKILNNEIN